MVGIIKVFGGPGAGKTTTLVGNTGLDDFQGVLEVMFEDRDPDDVMLIAYTRSAADEAKGRLNELTSVNKTTLDKRITTIHSLTMGMTGIYPNKIVEIRNVPDKYQFCEEQGVRYSRDNSDDDDIMDVPDDAGHQFFQIVGWLNANLKTISEWEDCPISSAWNQDLHDIEDLYQEWEMFKMQRGIHEFDDVIKKAVDEELTVDASELFVDEVQDIYPLQQAFLGNQMQTIDRIWLAGDDDQTIYEWAGADPDYFIGVDGRVENKEELDEIMSDKTGYWDSEGVYILNQSFRMPSNVLELSQRCIDRVDERQEKELKANHSGGEITYLDFPSMSEVEELINHNDTFVLFRANYQCNNFGRRLIENGIPFKDRFKTWRPSVVEFRDAVAALYNDDPYVSSDAADRLLSMVTSGQTSGSLGPGFGDGEISTADLRDCIRGRRINENRIDELVQSVEDFNYFQKQAIKNNVFQGRENLTPDGLTVETIHWSKGQEADTVILSLNTTGAVGSTVDGMPDAERRLYYVGMTRSKNKLVLAEALDSQSPTFTGDDLFGEDWVEEITE